MRDANLIMLINDEQQVAIVGEGKWLRGYQSLPSEFYWKEESYGCDIYARNKVIGTLPRDAVETLMITEQVHLMTMDSDLSENRLASLKPLVSAEC